MKIVIRYFLFIFFTFFMSAASDAAPQVAEIMNVESAAEQLFFVTVRVESEKIGEGGAVEKEISTGFIVTYRWGDNKAGDFLITSKHAVEGADNGRFFFVKARGGQPVLGETYNIEMDDFSNRWYKHPNPRVDVAVMPLAGILREIDKRKWKVFYKSIPQEIALGYGADQGLDAIEEVIFVGYPSGLFDAKNFLPVARRGVTATPLIVDYSGLPQFLIDASVFPGSSGSPVFIVNTGSYSDRKGNLILGNRVIFLGMISDLISRKELSEWEFDGQTKDVPALRTQQMIDIGVVYKAQVVFDTIKELLRASGETR